MQHSIEELYGYFLSATGVCTDTRNIEKGSIFFALKGPNFNGNKYADDALKKGASLVVIDEAEYKTSTKHFLVQDCLEALQGLARRHRKGFNKPVIGITGSNGKTTTKELLHIVLSTQYEVHYTLGNLNNHIGVPLTILKLDLDKADMAIIEMGANKVGDIAELCQIAMPTHGLITNIGTAHIGGFGGREGIIRGKSELFDYIRNHNGIAFINDSDEVLRNMGKRFTNKHSYPSSERLVSSDPTIVFELDKETYKSGLAGDYNFINISAAICLGNAFDVDKHVAAKAVCTYSPENNRSQILHVNSNRIILDAYNANPDSMKAALVNFNKMNATMKAVILGDMMELGEYSKEEHRKIGDLLGVIKPDATFFIGMDMKHAFDNYDGGLHFYKLDEFTEYLRTVKFENCLLLIKGSRSIGLEKIIDDIN